MAAKVRFKVTGSLDKAAKSGALAAQLEPIAEAILEAAKTDPNPAYVATLRKKLFVSGGKRGRVTWQIGAAPTIGARVEAKRGTLQRAVGRAGL